MYVCNMFVLWDHPNSLTGMYPKGGAALLLSHVKPAIKAVCLACVFMQYNIHTCILPDKYTCINKYLKGCFLDEDIFS